MEPVSSADVGSLWDSAIAAVEKCCNLCALKFPHPSTLDDDPEGDRANQFVGALCRLSKLTSLFVYGATPNQAGLTCNMNGELFSSSLRRLCTLEVLGISGGISVSGVDQLFSIFPELKALRTLHLAFVGVEQAAVVQVIPKLQGVTRLVLPAAVIGISGAGIDELSAQFPKLQIDAV